MNAKQFVKTYKQETFDTAAAKFLSEEYGFRLRQTAQTKCTGDDIWELSTAYFYTSQHNCFRHLNGLRELAERERMTVMVIEVGYDGQRLGAILNPTKDDIQFNSQPWPKQSWATMFVSISAK